jgi:tetratricopeptide (TPR) repeat protein
MGPVAFPHVESPAKPTWTDSRVAGVAGLLLAAVLVAYLPALKGGFLWDDDAHVTKPVMRSLHGLWRIWSEPGATQQYYPVLHSAFWIEHRLWGDSVIAYHIANAALHATAAWLLVLVLRRLSFPAPVLAGLLFALHPVCVESVAWISEQKNTLSAVFYLWAALLYLRFDETRGRASYLYASGLFSLALLTKTVTATLPAALLVVLWWRRGRLGGRRDVAPLLPWLAVGTACGLFTAWAERKLIGAEGSDFSFTALQRALLAGRAIVFYAGKLLWPSNLTFIYPRWTIRTGDAGPYLYPIGVLALLAALVILARKRRGPLAGFLIFSGTLFPVLGFVNVYPFIFSFVADHFQYLASIGIIVPLAWGLDRMAAGIPLGARGRACLLFAVPALLGFLSWRQCLIYRDEDTLNRATLARNPSAWLAHYNLAVSLGRRPDRIREAISEYEATLRLKPDHWAAHSNLGSEYLKIPGRSADAVAEFEAALRLNPGFAEAHNNLGIALGRIPGRLPEAISHVRTALRIRPDYDGALNNLGALLMRETGSLDEAIADFEAALRISPDNAEYHYDLANALAAAPGRLDDAVREYRAAIRLDPGLVEARSNLGAALARVPGRVSEAISEYEAAIRLAPADARIHANLANALARVPGRAADAVGEYSAALRLDPSDAQTHVDLGVVLSGIPGRLPDAVSEFRAAVRLKPDSAVAHYCLATGLLAAGGARNEAIGHLERALEIQPGFEPARRTLERLETAGR